MLENLTTAHDRQCLEPKYQWIQLNVGLVRQAGDALASARHLFAHLTPFVAAWRESNGLHNFFFMRKPPDVRLRFLVSNPEVVVGTLLQQMERLQEQGWIREFFFSHYQPELDRFGGSVAMDCVHHYFDQDTSLWLIYDQLCQKRLILPPEALLPLVFYDLFSRTLIEPHLVFKTWLALRTFIPFSPRAIVPQIQILSLSEFWERTTIIEEAHLLRGFAAANQKFADSFSLIDADQLTCDICSVLATIALFNFNRHGFSGERSDPLVTATLQCLYDSLLLPDL